MITIIEQVQSKYTKHTTKNNLKFKINVKRRLKISLD